MQKEWLFEPLDTLFFRDGLSLDMGEAGYVESIFPPNPQTMQGIVRSAVILTRCTYPDIFGSGKCADCDEYHKCQVHEQIGSIRSDDYGKLDIHGPYIRHKEKRYYPAPLDLMKEKDGRKRFFALKPGKAVSSDLGNIGLPERPESSDFGAFEPAGGWIEEDALLRYLDTKLPLKSDLLADTDLYEKEPKVGIAREYDAHKVKTGMLYSIVPLRFREDVKIGIRVGGIDKEIEPTGVATKAGGEGRLCTMEIPAKKFSSPWSRKKFRKDDSIKLILLQPADFNGGWLPFEDGYQERKQDDGTTCWEGQIEGIDEVAFRLVSACIGRQQRIGGWDMAKKAVKPMRSYVPAGSVYFLEACDDADISVEGKIGKNKAIGLGHYLLGRW